jgi:phosphatidylglycerophosphate synthase
MQATRRPLASRNTRWAAGIAAFLARCGIRPNAISITSVFFAGGAAVCLWLAGGASLALRPWLLVGAAVLIQLRLLCNLLDGMVAIEGGLKTKSGEVFNELPDRFADALILVGAGYSTSTFLWLPSLGWLCTVLAILTAYVRALGAYAGAGQQYCGPMAKPHRMATMTVSCLVCALLLWLETGYSVMPWALGVIAIGCVITVFRRTRRIIVALESR